MIRGKFNTSQSIPGSTSTTQNSIIFPKSGVAFLVLSVNSITVGHFNVKPDVLQLIEKFTQVHGRGYLLLVASLHGERELKIFSTIQSKFLKTKLQMIPVHNVDEGIQTMMHIAKVLCKPASDIMFERLSGWTAEFNIEDTIKNVLLQIGLTEHQAHILQDCLGSLSSIVRADKEALLDCSLDTETADKVMGFFSNSSSTIECKTSLHVYEY